MVLHWPISHAQTLNGLNQVAIPECCRITDIQNVYIYIYVYALYLCIVIL